MEESHSSKTDELGLTIKRSKSGRAKKVNGDGKRTRQSPHGSIFYFSNAPPPDIEIGDGELSSTPPTNSPPIDFRDCLLEDNDEILFDFKSLLEISEEELKLEGQLSKTESEEEGDDIARILENKSGSEEAKKSADKPVEDKRVEDELADKDPDLVACDLGGPSLSDPVLILTMPSMEDNRSNTEHWEEPEQMEVSYQDEPDEILEKLIEEDKKEARRLSAPASPKESPRRVLIKSDMIALDNIPSIKNPNKVARDLDLEDMWEILGSALVKHKGIRSLLLEIASPMHLKDLPLLERWAQAKLRNPQITASFASQAQVFELNALKRQTRRSKGRSKGRRKPRIRQRVLRNVPNWNGGGGRREKPADTKGRRLASPPGQLLLQPPQRPRSRSGAHRRLSASQRNKITHAERIMPIKCLFIDIEGIITPLEGPRLPRHYREISRALAKKLLVLKLVVHLSRCKLILTSVSRFDARYVKFVNSFFKSWGINPFYSYTQPYQSDNHLVRLLPEKQRAQEVEQWIASRNVKAWCAVDTMDLSILEKDETERTVMVNGNIGLTREDGQNILKILGVELELYR